MRKKGILLSLPLVICLVGCNNKKIKTTSTKSTTKQKITTGKRRTTGQTRTEPVIESKNIYVANVGLNSNSGLKKIAPTTLEHALETMSTGDTIYLLSGIYSFNDTLTISKSGSELKRNYLYCENGVIFDFSGTKDDDTVDNGGFILTGSYWEIDNLQVRNSDSYGIRIKANAVYLNNCIATDNSYGGFNIDSSESSFTKCVSKNNMLPGFSAYGFYITGSGGNNTYEDCAALDNQDSGFVVFATKAITFTNCLAISNGIEGDSASNQKSGFIFNNKGHAFINCLAYNNELNGFLVPFQYSDKGSYTLIGCSSINNKNRNYYLKTKNDDVLVENVLSYNTNNPEEYNDYVIGKVKNSMLFYDGGYYYEIDNDNYSSLDISKVKLDLDEFENEYKVNLIVPEKMKVYLNLEEKIMIDATSKNAGIEPDYSKLEYSIEYFKDEAICMYNFLNQSLKFQDELFNKLELENTTYFGAFIESTIDDPVIPEEEDEPTDPDPNDPVEPTDPDFDEIGDED